MRTKLIFIPLLASLLEVGFAQHMPHETYGDPPISRVFESTSPRAIVPRGPFTSVQVNVNAQGNNIIGDAANEPSLCVDPTNRNRKAIAWRQFDNVASNFRQAGYGYTANGGSSWVFPGVLTPGVFRSDPVLCADTSGKFYYNSLMQSFFTDVWSSVTGGASWQLVGPAMGGDKQWMTCDTTGGVSNGFLHEIWSTAGNNFQGRQFSRSTNSGATWIDPIDIPMSPVWGTLDVDAQGRLFIVGSNFGGSTFHVVRSSNANDAGVTPTFDQIRQVSMGGSVRSGIGPNPGGLLGQTWLVCDRESSQFAGNVYVLSTVQPTGTSGTIIRFIRSSNGGDTWSSSVRVNDDTSTSKFHWFGSLSVAPNGRLDAMWLDTRSDPGNLLSALYYSYSVDAGATWAQNIQISQPFHPHVGWPNQNKIGDYMQCVSDLKGVDVAYPATFNNEQDVYYVRITPPATSFAPNAFAFLTGSQTGGNLASLGNSDDVRLNGRPGAVLVSTQPPLRLELTGQSPYQYPSELTFQFEGLASIANLEQRIFLRNYQSGLYDEVDVRMATTTDTVVVTMPSGSASNYVGPSRQVKALITYKPTGPVLVYPWQIGVDQALWSARP